VGSFGHLPANSCCCSFTVRLRLDVSSISYWSFVFTYSSILYHSLLPSSICYCIHCKLTIISFSLHPTWRALYSLKFCADVPLRNYSLTHSMSAASISRTVCINITVVLYSISWNFCWAQVVTERTLPYACWLNGRILSNAGVYGGTAAQGKWLHSHDVCNFYG